jgi:hypothetical protein
MSNLLNNLSNPTSISDALTTIQQQYGPVLDDFKKYYVLYNQFPTYDEYSQMFASIKGNLQSLNASLFTETNNIDSSISLLNSIMTTLNATIQEEKNKNSSLKQKLQIVHSDINGATEMNNNYTMMYNLQYISNVTMILGILLVGSMIYNIKKK